MSKGKILIVEDDARITKALAIRLRASGYTIVTAGDGQGGVNALIRQRPDLVLLDISMPAGGGFFVAENLQRRPNLATTPIVFITASKSPEIRLEAEGFTPAAFVEKPFKSEELLAVIEAVLAGEAPPSWAGAGATSAEDPHPGPDPDGAAPRAFEPNLRELSGHET